MTASYDMNREQLLGLVAAAAAGTARGGVHQHMPMFHMEHCVFCAVLSPGTNKTNCGRPCDDHVVKLRDRIGVEHPLTADVGCRNTLYNAVPQSAAPRRCRRCSPAACGTSASSFSTRVGRRDRPDDARLPRACSPAGTTGREVWTQLQAANRVGVTRGTLEEKRNPLAII